ncbi:MAG: hypothetical protein LC637_01365 [Xanthomonadaceae bacterium]|nr:hypothetical protein [Xanthomonadaceae bacterium]
MKPLSLKLLALKWLLILPGLALLSSTGPLAETPPAPAWQFEPFEQQARPVSALAIAGNPLGVRQDGWPSDRPRLSVLLDPMRQLAPKPESSTFSWSLDAWEMNTASLAHIQCSRATHTIESFLVEDCRFVEQPLPEDSDNLIQIRGQWMAAPGLSVGAGVFSGRNSVSYLVGNSAGPALSPALAASRGPTLDPVAISADSSSSLAANNAGEFNSMLAGLSEDVLGANMNVSFGLQVGQMGSLLLDLQLERYQRRPDSLLARTLLTDPSLVDGASSTGYSNAGQLGIGWHTRQFSADLTGRYQELPHWLGQPFEGESLRSFDIEFSWRAPTRASISVGITNVLDSLPGAVSNGSDQRVEDAVDGIYGRIPYVRYKHDL